MLVGLNVGVGLGFSACSAPKHMPIRVIDRPLTMPDGTMEFAGEVQLRVKDEDGSFGERLGGGLATNHVLYGITDRLTWAFPVGIRYAAIDSRGKGTDLAFDVGVLPATSPLGGSLLAGSIGEELKARLSADLWVEQKTALRALRHFSGETFLAGWIYGALGQHLSERFSMRLGVAATRSLRITTKTALPQDDVEAAARLTWVIDRPVDVHWQLGGRFVLGDRPQRVPFTTIGVALRW